MRLLLLAGLLPALASAQFHFLFLPSELGPLASELGGSVEDVECTSATDVPDGPAPAAPATPRAAPEAPLPAPDGPRSAAGPLKEVYAWRQMDFEFPSEAARAHALASGRFDPAGTLPLGLVKESGAGDSVLWKAVVLVFSAQLVLLYLILTAVVMVAAYLVVDWLEVWDSRLFLALPRWKAGSPATLAWVPRAPRDATGARSPRLRPYPSWEWHGRGDCRGLTSVYRMAVDPCGQLWVLDSGAVDVATTLTQQCPPQLLVFDLSTDTLVRRHVLPQEHVKQGSLFSNVVLDPRGAHCEHTVAFLADVWRFGLVAYSFAEDRSWRTEHSYFLPDPLRTDYDLNGLKWTWRDGVFALALAPQRRDGDRDVFFHAMSSFRQFATRASVLRAQNGTEAEGALRLLGQPRGTRAAQASAAQVDRRGVMFYTLVARNAVGCWNTRHREGYRTALQGVVAQDNSTLVFPNDLKLDQDHSRQSLWVISNRLPFFLYSQLDPKEVNFRVLSAPVDTLTAGTVCDPDRPPAGVRDPPDLTCNL